MNHSIVKITHTLNGFHSFPRIVSVVVTLGCCVETLVKGERQVNTYLKIGK